MATLEVILAEASSKDCRISSGSNADVANDSSQLMIGTFTIGGPGNFYRSLLSFPLTGLPSGALVAGAVLTLARLASTVVGTPTFTFQRLTQLGWTEDGTWNRYDGTNLWASAGGDSTPTNAGNVVYGGSGSLVVSNLGELVADAAALSLASVDLLAIGPESLGTSNYFTAHSSAATDPADRPKLVITYYLPTISVADNGDGTGGVATIAGTEAGSTNTVYVAPATGPPAFASEGNRSGDGTVNRGLANGTYWAYVTSVGASGTVSSQLVFFTVSGGTDPARIATTLPVVLEAVAARLRTELDLNESTCYWMLDREDEDRPPPTGSNFYLTVKPDGGEFDRGLFEGGGPDQLTDSTGVVVTIHTHTQLDRGGRDKQVLLSASAGLLPYLKPVLRALSGHDLILSGSGNTCLRELIRPVGYSAPVRGNKDRWSRMDVYFALSFDWDMSED